MNDWKAKQVTEKKEKQLKGDLSKKRHIQPAMNIENAENYSIIIQWFDHEYSIH